ncbi:MAG: glucan 1,4-alpha-glucosidase, partial [Bacteroidota bacterium]|nr:glucan 1,4-alpha-glucosidase [Bacteroidota bacterium]
RAADDPKILNTIKLIDAKLLVETPGGNCWNRYNNDGYGEHKNGDPYDGTGIGRVWPLLAGERGHYEIAAGNLEGAKKLLKAMDNFANNGLLSEQVWDTEDMPEKDLFFGKHSGSAMPLTWAHAEYIKLCCSIRDKKIIDMPPQTKKRYLEQKAKSCYAVWRFSNGCTTISSEKKLRIEVMAEAIVSWSQDNWTTTTQTPAADKGIGIFVADIPVPNENAGSIEFTFFWTKSNKWENKNYSVNVKK